ncbi:MAG: hypothetical protein HY263_03355 [Chloroflexi bacterium]|nr:hypothetical protein [Chloroflexota bacterium]
MSPDQPDLLRKLLGDEAPPDIAGVPPSPPAGERPLIQVGPDDPDYVPRPVVSPSAPDEPPRGLRRFGPSAWPWPATTGLARVRNVVIVVLAIAGAIAGLFFTWYHLTTDPLADARAYFDAASRLNHGQSLYPVTADPSAAAVYRYPPLLAVALRPVVLLGWPAFAAIWEAIVVGSFVLLVRRLGAGVRTWLALGILAMPVGWCLAIGEVQVPLTLLLAIGQPWSIALGANLNLFTALAALWWIGRRDAQATGAFVAWVILFGLAQAILELNGSLAFVKALGADRVGTLLSASPLAVAPLMWALVVGLGIIAALVSAKSRWGWLAAVTLASLAALPLLFFRLTGLLAAVREPEIAGAEPGMRPLQPMLFGRRG